MCTSTQIYQGDNSDFGFLFGQIFRWGLLFLLIIVFIIAVQWCLHAQNHANGTAIRQCFIDGKAQATLQSPTDPNRFFYICEVTPKKFGILILQKIADGTYREVTAFFNKGKTITEVEQYIINSFPK